MKDDGGRNYVEDRDGGKWQTYSSLWPEAITLARGCHTQQSPRIRDQRSRLRVATANQDLSPLLSSTCSSIAEYLSGRLRLRATQNKKLVCMSSCIVYLPHTEIDIPLDHHVLARVLIILEARVLTRIRLFPSTRHTIQ